MYVLIINVVTCSSGDLIWKIKYRVSCSLPVYLFLTTTELLYQIGHKIKLEFLFYPNNVISIKKKKKKNDVHNNYIIKSMM